MEIILLGIYSFFIWLIFFKFKWLPWNITSQVIVITLPIIGLSILILLLNLFAPSSHDVRVLNYTVEMIPDACPWTAAAARTEARPPHRPERSGRRNPPRAGSRRPCHPRRWPRR